MTSGPMDYPRINPKSKELINSKSMSTLPVHERLHHQGLSAIRNKNETDKLAHNKIYKTQDEMDHWKPAIRPQTMN